MKRFLSIAVVLAILFSLAPKGYADGPVDKLGRGLSNVVVSPLEIPKTAWDTYEAEQKGFFMAIIWGIPVGIFNFAKRAVVGVYEVATFPVPLPANYEPVIEPLEPFAAQ